MNMKEFITDRTKVLLDAIYELSAKVDECRGKFIDDVPSDIWVFFDDGHYSICSHYINTWLIWDEINGTEPEPFVCMTAPSSLNFDIITNMLYEFLQHCYDQDVRFKDLEFPGVA